MAGAGDDDAAVVLLGDAVADVVARADRHRDHAITAERRVEDSHRGEPDRKDVVVTVVGGTTHEHVAVGGLHDPTTLVAGPRPDVGGPDAITVEGGVESAVGVEAQDEDVVVAAVVATAGDQQVAVRGDVEAVAVVVSRADGVERLAVRGEVRVQVP